MDKTSKTDKPATKKTAADRADAKRVAPKPKVIDMSRKKIGGCTVYVKETSREHYSDGRAVYATETTREHCSDGRAVYIKETTLEHYV